ncbi:MAG: hypothetical protein PUP92_31285 [Rhizonema sp. PD38]|nr:hypothetical protein [Rhizonema sp. PD38]
MSDHTTSLVRGSSGLGGKPLRPVTVKLLPPTSAKAAQFEETSLGVFSVNVGRVTKPRLGSISGVIRLT